MQVPALWKGPTCGKARCLLVKKLTYWVKLFYWFLFFHISYNPPINFARHNTVLKIFILLIIQFIFFQQNSTFFHVFSTKQNNDIDKNLHPTPYPPPQKKCSIPSTLGILPKTTMISKFWKKMRVKFYYWSIERSADFLLYFFEQYRHLPQHRHLFFNK